MPYIQISIRTKLDTFNWQFGRELIRSLCEGEGPICPEQISNNPDRFIEPFVSIEECEAYWAAKGSMRVNGSLIDFHDDFAWRRKKKIKCVGSIQHKTQNIKGNLVPGSVNFSSACNDKINWFSLFRLWCEIFSPQLGMLHKFDGVELDPKSKNNSFQVGSFKAALKPEVSNIGWAMFYGDEFAEVVEADRIKAAGFPIEKIGSGYLVRVTENIQDVVNDFPLFSRRRAELKALFREGFFLIQDEPLI
ncbi:hypothetical protein [Pseudomonas sp. Fl4BN1]|uniref:hypothetical protein n=1 Tax=Pseudomonas sp. Fl4BN1 TaxID=2697651 RepID=UPI0015B71B3E|nr:hypothetical protein [Pseudomonas sp. Fl4BN1]